MYFKIMHSKTTSTFKYAIVLISSLAISVFASTSHISLPVLSRSQECPVKFPYQKPYGDSARRNDTETVSRKDKLNQDVQSRIGGGDSSDFHTDSANELADYMAALLEYDVRFLTTSTGNGIPFKVCSAAVVSPTLLVSSASCAIGKKFALVGSDEAFNLNTSTLAFNRSIARVIPDPRFDLTNYFETMRYDFAFVELKARLPDRVRQMRVSGEATLPARDTFTRTAGFGNIYRDGEKFYNPFLVLEQLDMPTFDSNDCQRRYNVGQNVELSVDSNLQICVGYFNRSKECHICEGDLGGPLIQYGNDGVPVLVGVSSYNGQSFDSSNTVCKIRQIPTIFTRSGQYVNNFTDYGLDIVGTRDIEDFPNPNVSPSSTPIMNIESPLASPSTTPIMVESAGPSSTTPSNAPGTPLVSPQSPSTSPSPIDNGGGGISGGAIAGIAGGVLGLFILVLIILFAWRYKSRKTPNPEQSYNDEYDPNLVGGDQPEVFVNPTVYTPSYDEEPAPRPATATQPTPPTQLTPPTIISFTQ